MIFAQKLFELGSKFVAAWKWNTTKTRSQCAVAAVLGIIRTMGAIDQEPAILGAMIGAALLGTFLGVFLAYGLVGPIAARYGQIVEEEALFLETIRSVIRSFGEGAAPSLAIEMARTLDKE